MNSASKPRILVLAQNLPYPCFSGKDLRNWQNVSILLKFAQVGVFGLCFNDTYRTHSPDARLAFWRSTLDPNLCYPPPVGPRINGRAWIFDELGYPSDLFFSDRTADEIVDLIGQFQPDAVLFEGLYLHRYFEAVQSSNCRVILDCHNVEAALNKELDHAGGGREMPAGLKRVHLSERIERIERESVRKANQIWACSDDDASMLRRFYSPESAVFVVPNGIDAGFYDSAHENRPAILGGRAASRKAILYPGLFAYQPNLAAVRFLIERLFPMLTRAHPDCQLWLVGDRPTSEMIEASKRDPRILVTGPVKDLRPYFAAASMMVAPLFHGGGTRLKILEAFASALPVAATAKAAEGIEATDGKHYLRAEDADEFVQSIERLWADADLRKKLQKQGMELVRRRYSWEANTARIRHALEGLWGEPTRRSGSLS
jgi:glycosyltransferase involved in cell wall biosynthesis